MHEVRDKATSLVSLGDLSDGPPRPNRPVIGRDENLTELAEAISPKNVASVTETQSELHLDATVNKSPSQQIQRRNSDSPTNKQGSSTGLHSVKVEPATEWT